MILSPQQHATLCALASAILDGAPPATESIPQLVDRCAARALSLPPHRQALVGTAIDVLGAPATVLLAIQRFRRFADLAPIDQRRCFAAWTDSSLPPLRAAWQTVRRLVLSVHYARPEVAAAIGYGGPFRTRAALRAWEGPIPDGTTTVTGEPVARGHVRLPNIIEPDPLPAGVFPGHTVTQDVQRRADVVVIGSGAGGAVAAARLAEAGYDVVILESGGWHTRSDFTDDEAALTERLYADGCLRATDDGSVALVQGDTAGGSTTVNWMIMLRTPAHVLEQWARESGITGMSPREMIPVFEQIEREVHAAEVPDEAHSANNRIVLDGARALGWRVEHGRINARGCVRCGFCGTGCRHNAKQSTLLTYLPRALAAQASLYTDAQVQGIEVRERDSGKGTPPLKRVHAVLRDRQRGTARTLAIDAPLVVVAGGAVGTPVLLQRSGMGGGGVGQWLRLHPTTALYARYDREIVTSTGIPLTTMCDEFLRWQGSDYGFWIETPPMHPSFTAAAMPGTGAAHAAEMRDFNRFGVTIGLTRDGAERQRSSGSVTVTRRGETSIRYRLTLEDERRVRASLPAMARLHFAMGATSVTTMHAAPLTIRSPRDVDSLATASIAPNRMALFSAHVNGTCRMGTDPATSGATPDGERHGVRGLYITDGAALPTALGVNPQETIMAVSTVLAGRIAARHAGLLR